VTEFTDRYDGLSGSVPVIEFTESYAAAGLATNAVVIIVAVSERSALVRVMSGSFPHEIALCDLVAASLEAGGNGSDGEQVKTSSPPVKRR
jgi:hypothetical protein